MSRCNSTSAAASSSPSKKQIAGIDPGQMRAIFMPTEFATLGEGNFSDGNLNIYMNYGNPPYIEAVGGLYDAVMPRFAHEYVHELFSEVSRAIRETTSA